MPDYHSTKPKPLPPAKYLRERLNYLPETGELTWRRGIKANRQRSGLPAGTRSTEYIRVMIDHFLYPAHRVIWKWMTGEDPPSDIDHRDRNGFNNRWANLRLATRTQAVWNRKLPRRRDLPCGVEPSNGGKWRARIMINDVRLHLGTFSTVEAATAAYETAANNLHGNFRVTLTSS